MADRAWYWGTPYRFGGFQESSGGLDCSQFVQARFWILGIDIDPEHETANTNAERLRQACDPVTAPERGDLVFFKGTYDAPGATHVGIIREPGMMLDDHDRGPGSSGPGFTSSAESSTRPLHSTV
mgnify:CR=1 FL=1